MPHLPVAPEIYKKSQKANLNRLIKPADLSQISPAIASRQLSEPADDGPHNSAWGLGGDPGVFWYHDTLRFDQGLSCEDTRRQPCVVGPIAYLKLQTFT